MKVVCLLLAVILVAVDAQWTSSIYRSYPYTSLGLYNLRNVYHSTYPSYVAPSTYRYSSYWRSAKPMARDELFELIAGIDNERCTAMMVCSVFANELPEGEASVFWVETRKHFTPEILALMKTPASNIFKEAVELGKVKKSNEECKKIAPNCLATMVDLERLAKLVFIEKHI